MLVSNWVTIFCGNILNLEFLFDLGGCEVERGEVSNFGRGGGIVGEIDCGIGFGVRHFITLFVYEKIYFFSCL